MEKILRWILPLLLLIVSGSGVCIAQSTNSGDIRGSVTDPSGALIPDVTVTVLNVDTGVSKDYVTNRDGLYDTSSIVAGNYKITFAKTGFDKLVRGPITLQVGVATINGQLKVGSASEIVTVSSDIALLQTETGDQTVTMESGTMSQLPQIGNWEGQSWENFMIMLPGTSGCTGGGSCGQGSSNPGQSVASNGNLPYSGFLADGASTELAQSMNSNVVNYETLSELQVSQSSFSAQYGMGGMIVNQITKGGTSQFHGSAYDYMENTDFNSQPHNFTSTPNPLPVLRYQNFGFSVGGPVIGGRLLKNLRKKAFFYFNYDQTVNHGAAYTGTNTIPTNAIMGGDFSADTQLIYDPTTQTMATDKNGNPYPVRKSFLEEYGTNAIPLALIDKVASGLQAFYPTASHHNSFGHFVAGGTDTQGLTEHNWYSSVPNSSPAKKYFGRLDYDITPNNRLTMSETESDYPGFVANSFLECPVGCEGQDLENNNAQVSDVWNVSSTLINEARLGFTDELSIYDDQTLGKGYASKLGWQFPEADSLPTMNVNTFSSIGPATNAVYKENNFDPSDVVTMIRGKHVLRFGGEIAIYRNDSTAWGNEVAGSMNFSGQYTQGWKLNAKGVAYADSSTSGISYADFLLGYAQSWWAAVSPEYGARLKEPQMFVQDDFKVRPNLTINLGVRYQINHGWSEVKGNADSFDPTVMNTATNTLGAYWYESTHANGRNAMMANTFNTFLPRVGFSWLPLPNTTVRGGIGLYSYNWSLDNYAYGMGGAVSASGSISDQTNGITPIVKLDGKGAIFGTSTPLPYTTTSTDPTRFNGQNVTATPYHIPVPRAIQWNFAVQRQLGANYVAEVAYVGTRGFDLQFPTDYNAVPLNKLSSGDSQDRPYPQFGGIWSYKTDAISNYDSLQAKITKRLTSGLSLNFNYVWSHFLDDQDSSSWGSRMGPQPFQNAQDPKADYSNSNFDVRHAFKGYFVYQLPFGKGEKFLNNNALLDAVIGGWQATGTVVLTTGQPFTVYADGNTYQQTGQQFPNWNPGVNWKPAHQSIIQWYNPQAFTKPADGTFGNVRRNSLYGPGSEGINLSASKSYSLPWEGVKLQIHCDASNAFNHTSWGQVDNNYLSSANESGVYQGPNNQQINGTAISGRSLQLIARVTF
jgi:hypothetical protein